MALFFMTEGFLMCSLNSFFFLISFANFHNMFPILVIFLNLQNYSKIIKIVKESGQL